MVVSLGLQWMLCAVRVVGANEGVSESILMEFLWAAFTAPCSLDLRGIRPNKISAQRRRAKLHTSSCLCPEVGGHKVDYRGLLANELATTESCLCS